MNGVSPISFAAAVTARRRGATGREIAPLLLPLSGGAATTLTAVNVIRNQRQLDALGREVQGAELTDKQLEGKTGLRQLLERPRVKGPAAGAPLITNDQIKMLGDAIGKAMPGGRRR
jgi:hypothetical protein